MVWYSHLLKNFPQFIVIHTVKGFGIVNKAETDAFLELSCFFDDPADVCNLIPGSSAFSKTSLNIRKFFSILFLYFFALITEEVEVERFCEDLQDLLELIPKKDVLFIIGDWNAIVGSQEIPGVKGNLALECGMKQGKD